MMRSMFSGVSGLRAHQTRMDVIGNNVANVNTVGFKSGRVTFQEVFSQTLKGASSPDSTTGRGGSNPMQIGLGLGVGAIDTIMTRGSTERTDNPTDLSIEGEGFFVVKGGSGDTFKFTRAGNFGIDKLGNLVTSSGLNVYGWQKYTRLEDGTYKFDTEQQIEPINLYSDDYNKNKRMIAAKATENAVFSGNLDASTAIAASATAPTSDEIFTTPFTVYDKLGNSYKINLQFWKTAADANGSTWTMKIPDGSNFVAGGYGTGATLPSIHFLADGSIDPASVSAITNTTIEANSGGTTATNASGTGAISFKIDLSKLTTYSADSSVKATNVDGYSTGSLVTFSIGNDGMLTGIYSNGQQQPLGLVGIASFENPAGLQKAGENLYMPTTNSGDFKKAVKAGTEGVGTLSPGTLEMSNVDLSKEFTDMIVTQRGFQANSRIITTTDEMLQELVNLKR